MFYLLSVSGSAYLAVNSMRARICPLVWFIAIFPVARMPLRKLALREFLINVRDRVHGD